MDNIKKKRNVLFIAILTSFITTFMGSALNLSIPQIEAELNAGAAGVNWIITVYMLVCAALAVPFGRLGDLISKKKILCTGLFVFFVSSLAASFSTSLEILIILRLFQGIGASMIFSTNIAILVSFFDDEYKGKALGYATAANYVGLSAGPVAGGFLNAVFGWNSIFIVTAAVSFVAFCCALIKIDYTISQNISEKNIKWRDVFFYVASLCLTMYGLSQITISLAGKICFATGITLFIIFILIQIKCENPMIDVKSILMNRPYLYANIAAAFNYGAVFATSYLVSIYLQIIKGYDSKWAGIILVVAPIVQSVLSPISGKISDKFSPQLISAAGIFICGISTISFSFLNVETDIKTVMLSLVLLGIGCALFSAPNSNAVMMNSKKEAYGLASSMLATMRSIGHTAAMALVTMISSMYVGDEKMSEVDPALLIEIIRIAFYVFTVWCIIGFFMALKRKP